MRPNNGVRTHRAFLNIHQVHRATLAVQQATLPTHQFTQNPGHRDATNQRVIVATIGAEGVVVLAHGYAETRRDGLLAEGQVRRAFNQVLHKQVVRALLHHPAGLHLSIQFKARIGVRCLGVLDGSHELPVVVTQWNISDNLSIKCGESPF